MIATTTPTPFDLLAAISGFLLWAAGFSLLYGILSVGCELGWQHRMLGPATVQRLVLVLLWLAHIALHVVLLRWLWRRPRPAAETRIGRFIRAGGVGIGVLGLAATLWTEAPVIFLSTCSP